jgi:hypothetical protein
MHEPGAESEEGANGFNFTGSRAQSCALSFEKQTSKK